MNTNNSATSTSIYPIGQLSTLQLFEETKRQLSNIESYSKEGCQSLIQSSNLKPLMRVQNIVKVVTKRIRNNQHCSHRDFIGYLSILCRLTPLLRTHNFSLNFDLRFYRSLKKSILKTETEWTKIQNLAKSTQFKTLLYIIATFCSYAKLDADSKSSGNILNWKYILNPQLLTMICQLKVVAEPLFLKYYQTIMFYYLESNPKNLSNSFMFKSVCGQLISAQHSVDSLFSFLYIINKFSARLFGILDNTVTHQIFVILKKQILQPNQDINRSYWLLCFCVLEKVLVNTNFIYEPEYLMPTEVFGFLQKLEMMNQMGIRISRTCKSHLLLYLSKIVEIFSDKDQEKFILTGFQSEQLINSYILLELLETACKTISNQIIFQLVQQNHLQKLIVSSSSLDGLHEEVISQVINNIKKCNTNLELAFVINTIILNLKDHYQSESRSIKYHFN